MRWDAAIHGRLVVPAQHRKSWLAAELDWKSVEGHEVLKGYISGETVADMVEGVNFAEPTEFLDIRWDGDELVLRSFVSQAGFNESMVGFAAAWAAGVGLGATGELVGIGMGSRFGFRITIASGKVAVVKVADDGIDALAAHPDAVALREQMAAKGGAMAAKLAASAAPIADAPKPMTARVAAPKAVVPAKTATVKKASAKKAAAAKKA